MYNISYFGQNYTATGSLRDALALNNVDIGNNRPYVNGTEFDVGATPPAGSTVTFRPAASGKQA